MYFKTNKQKTLFSLIKMDFYLIQKSEETEDLGTMGHRIQLMKTLVLFGECPGNWLRRQRSVYAHNEKTIYTFN